MRCESDLTLVRSHLRDGNGKENVICPCPCVSEIRKNGTVSGSKVPVITPWLEGGSIRTHELSISTDCFFLC